MRTIVIADIHGHPKTLKGLLYDTLKIQKSDSLFFLGDYIDRGPNSVAVIDELMLLREMGYDASFLMGNHEHMLLKEIDNKRRTLPAPYEQFLRSFLFYHTTKEYIFVHAGFNLKLEDPSEDRYEMMWAAHWRPNIYHPWVGERKIIYGHHVTTREQIKNSVQNQNQYICIENGIFKSSDDQYGFLCALDLTNRTLFFQENLDNPG